MAVYQIGNQSIHSDDPALPEALAAIYAAKQRPLCLCRHPGIEMYVAKVEDKYFIKRMPNSGGDHAPACDWGSKPEPPKIPSADQRGLSRARSMG